MMQSRALIFTICLALACGPAEPASDTVVRGSDSAGAIVELVVEDGRFESARVLDTVLGAAEAKVEAPQPGGVQFTIHFPNGATILYAGQRTAPSVQDALSATGRWYQLPSGLFGPERGTWQVPD